MMNDARGWAVLAALAGGVAALAARRATALAWERVTDEQPPTIQRHPETRKLLVWTALSAVVVAMASMSVRLGVHAMRDDTDLGSNRE